MASIYSYNKQIVPDVLLNDVIYGLPGYPAPSVSPIFLNYDAPTFNIDIYYDSALSAGDQTKLTDIVNAYVYEDLALNATFNDITSLNIANTSGITTNTMVSVILSGGTLYGDGSNLTGILNNYVTGGTYSNGTLTLTRQNGVVTVPGFYTGSTDLNYYVTGVTWNPNTLTVKSNNGDVTTSINNFTSLTVNGSFSATTYLGLPVTPGVYVTGFTYNNANILTISQNSGNTLNVNINNFTGLTINGLFSATTYLGLPVMPGVYVTGFTYNNAGLLTISQTSGTTYSTTISNFTGLTVNGSFSATTYLGLPIDPDYYVTGATYNNGILTLIRQNGIVTVSVTSQTGATVVDTYVTGFTFDANILTLSQTNGQPDLSVYIQTGSTTGTDNYVTGGTYNNNDGTLTLTRQNGSVIIPGFTTGGTSSIDTYVTGFTYNNANVLTILQNNGQTDLPVTISNFNNLTVNGSFSATTYLGLPLDVDVYVTGFTYNNAGLLSVSRTSGSTLNVTISNFTGLTVSGSFSATTYLGLPIDPDDYVTGGTFNRLTDTITLTRQNGIVNITGITDTFATGFTYSNNTINLSFNESQSNRSIVINSFTGLTINGDLVVTGETITTMLMVTTNPVAGYVLTSNSLGDATWQAPATAGSGSTKLDIQSATGNTSVTSTLNSSTWIDIGSMTITSRNLTLSATTYVLLFSCTAALSANAGSGNFQIVRNGNTLIGSNRNRLNVGAAMAGANIPISLNAYVGAVKNGDIFKVQFNSAVGQWTVTDRAFTIMGILTQNLA